MPLADRQVTRRRHHPRRRIRAAQRKARRAALLPIKRLRRIALGPYCTLYFESFDTMLFQIQEMLLVEKGGEEQLKDELAAYNPLIPQGRELVATVMFEIDDAARAAPDPRPARRGGELLLPEDRRPARVRPPRRRRRAHAGRQDLVGPLPALPL